MMPTGKTLLLRRLLQVLVLMILKITVTSASDQCQNSTRTGPPRLMPGFAKKVEAYTGKYIGLHCCASGFDSIQWYRKDGQVWTNLSNSNLIDRYKIRDDGQFFEIFSTHPVDDTYFRCDIIKNGRAVVNGTVLLKVYACRQSGQGPVFTNPFPSNLTITEFGGDATFECSISLPCTPVLIVFFRWCINTCKGQLDPSQFDSRYNMTTYIHKDNKFLKTSVLRIHNVSPKDLDRQFICQVDTPDITRGHSLLRVGIFKELKELPTWAIALLAVSGLLLVVVVIGIIAKCVWGPRLRLFINSHIPFLAPKPVSREVYKNNVFIVHADDKYDQDIAIELREKLLQYNLKVIISGDIMGCQNTVFESEKLHKESAHIIVLNSSNLAQNRLWNWFLDNLTIEREGKRMTIVDLEDEATTPGPEIADLNRQQSVPDMDGGANNENTDMQDTCRDNEKRLFMGMHRYKFPSKQSSKRKLKNFECKLVNLIPKFKEPEMNGNVQGNGVPIEEQRLIGTTPPPTQWTAEEGRQQFEFDIPESEGGAAGATQSLISFDDYIEQVPDRRMNEDDQHIQDHHNKVRADVHGTVFPNDGMYQGLNQQASAGGAAYLPKGTFSPSDCHDTRREGQGHNIPLTYNGTEQNDQLSWGEGAPVTRSYPVPMMNSPHTMISVPSSSNETSMSGESGYITSPPDSMSPATAT